MSYFSTTIIYKFIIQALILFIIPNIRTPPAFLINSKNSPHIVFIENSWTEALKQAQLQKKYIFVDAYATWCGPCKMLKTYTFTNDKAAEFYNNNFINVSIDMEKGQGPELAAKWMIQAYPTLIIFNQNGKPVLGTIGFIKADELIRFGKQALNK